MHITRLTTIAAAALVLALGSAAPTFAAAKKTAAAPAPAPQPNGPFCVQPSQPVCALKGGERFTYANPCFAEKDGAKVVSQGACKVAKKSVKKPRKKTAAHKTAKTK